MKSKIFLKAIAVIFLIVFSNCSNDEGNGESENKITNVTIQTSATEVFVGETVYLTAIGNNGEDITNSSTFTINGSTISGNSYSHNTAGEVNITATYGSLTSNTLKVNFILQAATTITLSADVKELYPNETVTFTVVGDNGADLTSTSTISVDGNVITGKSYVVTTIGTISAMATYENLTSNTIDIKVNEAPLRFTKNVLIEDYTGAWCGYCPRVAYGIDLVEQQTDKTVVVAIHRGNTTPGANSYDPFNFQASQLENLINLTGYPTAMLNRTTPWNYPEPNNISQVVNLTKNGSEMGLAINSALNGNELSIDIKVKFGEDYSNSDLKLVVYILEDGLILDQVNYTSYYGGSSILSDFEHNHVLRSSLTNLLGDDIPSTNTNLDEVYSKNYSLTVPDNITDSSKMSIVAFVINSNNAAVNSRASSININQEFEEVN